MEAVKQQASLKGALTRAVAVTMLAVVLLAGLTVSACHWAREGILPQDQMVLTVKTTLPDGSAQYLEQRFRLGDASALLTDPPPGATADYTIERITSGFAELSPGQQAAYRTLGAAMVLLPVLYGVAGIGLCAWWFYQRRLAPPIAVLAEATEKIRAQDLDFTVACPGEDELGRLCAAFEETRQALWDNNCQLWETLRQGELLQASVAHDLRNPIAILEGYTERLQRGLQAGTLTRETLGRDLEVLSATAKRLEQYTDGLREVRALEKLPLTCAPVPLPGVIEGAAESFRVLAAQRGLAVTCQAAISPCQVELDQGMLYRILENLLANSLRYAAREISLEARLEGEYLLLEILDDGPGFPPAVLAGSAGLFYTEDPTGEHLGLGLATSRLLCRKMGGSLTLTNRVPQGAGVVLRLPAPPAAA